MAASAGRLQANAAATRRRERQLLAAERHAAAAHRSGSATAIVPELPAPPVPTATALKWRRPGQTWLTAAAEGKAVSSTLSYCN